MTGLDQRGFDRAGGGRHYDPNQPRVPAGDQSHHGGQWTKGRVTHASGAAPVLGEAEVFGPYISPVLRAALSYAAAVARGAFGIVAGILLVPTQNELRFAEGRLPYSPDVRYRYDGGILTVARDIGDGEELLIFHGVADADGLYRTAEGAVIGRDLGNGVVLNEQAIFGEKQRRLAIAQAGAAARARDEVKLCPDATPERTTRDMDNYDVRWRLYQHQITGVEIGKAVMLNDVEFDGCRTKDGLV